MPLDRGLSRGVVTGFRPRSRAKLRIILTGAPEKPFNAGDLQRRYGKRDGTASGRASPQTRTTASTISVEKPRTQRLAQACGLEQRRDQQRQHVLESATIEARARRQWLAS